MLWTRGVATRLSMKTAPTPPDSTDASTPKASEVPELKQGTQLGRFTVRKLLGKGGMGVVYSADDDELSRRVAIKVLRAARSNEQLRKEGKALAALSHPNVVMVLDTGQYLGQGFLAMEFMANGTLE